MSGQLNTVLQSTKLPILLRVPEVADASALLDLLSDPRNTEYDPHAGNGTFKLSQIEGMITRMRESAASDVPGRVNLVLVDTSLGNQVIGLGGFGGIATEGTKRIGDVGIMIKSEARHKGYAVEAVKLSIDYAFNVLKLDQVTATMLAKNIPMRKLLDKRLKLTGTKRESEFGEEVFYSILPEEWAKLQA
ncbi:acetyltransferase [Umbelopsis sp. PMI_123]|nr:acetyltransferase [Umbelopsis sp. PMI_123]